MGQGAGGREAQQCKACHPLFRSTSRSQATIQLHSRLNIVRVNAKDNFVQVNRILACMVNGFVYMHYLYLM